VHFIDVKILTLIHKMNFQVQESLIYRKNYD